MCRHTQALPLTDVLHSPGTGPFQAGHGDSATTLGVAAVSAGLAGSGLRKSQPAVGNQGHCGEQDGAGRGGSEQSEQVQGSEHNRSGKSHRRLGSWAGPVLQVQAARLADSASLSVESDVCGTLQAAAGKEIQMSRFLPNTVDTSGPSQPRRPRTKD